jgi:hypothetical protein
MAGVGSTDWHAQCPFANHMCIPRSLISTIVRLELYLPHPRLAFNNGTRCHGCNSIATEDLGHHATCCKLNNDFGSRTRWHNKIRDAVISIAKGAGLQATPKCRALLGPDDLAARMEDRDKDKVADLNIQDLRPQLLGVLGDVSIVHPIAGTYPHKPNARTATEQGVAVRDVEKVKNDKYAALAAKRDFGFDPMCVETYGRLGHAFIAFLREVAIHAAMRVAGVESAPTGEINTAFNAHVSRLLRGYIRHISLVRVRGIALRVKSASFGRVTGHVARPSIAGGAGTGGEGAGSAGLGNGGNGGGNGGVQGVGMGIGDGIGGVQGVGNVSGEGVGMGMMGGSQILMITAS